MAERRQRRAAPAPPSAAGAAPRAARSPGRRTRVRPPSARSLEREQEIYDVAADIFHRKGYAGTTLQDIADAVGLLKGSLYYYIDSKEDLLYRITQDIHEGARRTVAASAAVGGPPSARLRALVEGHVLAFRDRLAWIRVFYTEHTALTGERRREIMAERRAYEAYVDGLLAEGQADGSFCPDMDPRVARNGILTMVNSVYLWYRPAHDPPIERIATMYGDFVLNGLRCAPSHDHGTRAVEAGTGLC